MLPSLLNPYRLPPGQALGCVAIDCSSVIVTAESVAAHKPGADDLETRAVGRADG